MSSCKGCKGCAPFGGEDWPWDEELEEEELIEEIYPDEEEDDRR